MPQLCRADDIRREHRPGLRLVPAVLVSLFFLLLLCGQCLAQAAPPAINEPVPPTPPTAPQVPGALPPLEPQPGTFPQTSGQQPLPLPGLNTAQQPPAVPQAYVSPQDLARFTQSAHDLWRKLQRAYPDFVADLDIRQTMQGPMAYLTPLNGEPILLLDRQERRDQALWENPSLGDTLLNPQASPYPRGEEHRHPAAGFNPGRARSTPFLKALYGQSVEEVRAALESVNFLGQNIPFNSRHGAAAALRRVATRLEHHLSQQPEDKVYILPLAGTFNPRSVAGSRALSAHALAIAIDLNAEKGPYWRWRSAPEVVEQARQNYPQAIVDAFEAEGFIWGGKWDAYDFMHFEYRPEIE